MKHTKEQIADYFKWLKINIGWIDPYEFSKEHQAITLELLELQVSKKPTNFKITALAYSPEALCFYKCPTCDLTTIHGANYCNNCGQHIDWSDVI
jgi:hypothetical protein